MNTAPSISVNERAAKLVARLVADAAELKIGISRGQLGEALIDAGSKCLGSIAAGLRVAEICMGGFGVVRLVPSVGDAAMALDGRHPILQPGDCLSREPICRLAPFA